MPSIAVPAPLRSAAMQRGHTPAVFHVGYALIGYQPRRPSRALNAKAVAAAESPLSLLLSAGCVQQAEYRGKMFDCRDG